MKTRKYVAYYRVSTRKQENSGLGLDAQRQIIEDKYAGFIAASFTEVESGWGRKKRIRPRALLQKAIDYCKKNGAILVIAKLDRLARSVGLIFQLRDAGIEFECCDVPDFNTLTLAVFAAMAERESELISQRTSAALAAKKKRLGLKKLHNNLTPPRRAIAYRERPERARGNTYNQRAIEYIRELLEQRQSFREIARRLNKHGYETPRGRSWYASSVRNLIRLYDRNE